MEESATRQHTNWLYFFISCAVLINFTGLFVPVMGPDGALYASVARTMAENNNFTDLFAQGKDWLDKPHFPFWVTAVFFKLFGVNTWAYKLPGVLFTLLGAYYTYRFAKELYTQYVGLWAALLLLTAQHVIICTMDVRAEPFLSALIIASVYHFYKSMAKKWFLHLVLAAVFAACAVMTKGIFALIPIAGAIAGDLLIKRDWKNVFNFRWLLALVFVLIFILPELYSLYVQFDLHPEKIVFGQQNTSGIKFFFWDSQFGRFFNTGPIKKSNGDPTFFLHTILWAYLPWCLIFYAAIYQFFRKNSSQAKMVSWHCITGSLLTLFVFSISKFQLPFYIVIVFPFFSIICAQYICNLKLEISVKAVKIAQTVVCSVMLLLVIALHYFFQPAQLSVILLLAMGFSLVLFIVVTRTAVNGRFKIFFQCCAVVFILNLYFNLAYYPALLKYQADSEAAFWINSNNPDNLPVVQSRIGFGYGLDFYAKAPLYYFRKGEEQLLPQKPYIIYGEKEFLEQHIPAAAHLKPLKTFDTYRISRLKAGFINKRTRHENVSKTMFLLIK